VATQLRTNRANNQICAQCTCFRIDDSRLANGNGNYRIGPLKKKGVYVSRGQILEHNHAVQLSVQTKKLGVCETWRCRQILCSSLAAIARIKGYNRVGLSEQCFGIVRSRLLHAINYFGHRPLAE
jgi:hypothetical protein